MDKNELIQTETEESPNDYKVSLEIFEGPLDLLLYLVKKEEVDIHEVEIVKVIDQYLEYIELFKMLDLDVAGEFIVMASTLMYIKSKMLLPPEERPVDEEEEEDPRLELIKQLVEYKKFKEAAQQLGQKAQLELDYFSREKGGAPPVEPGSKPIESTIFDLISAFSQVLSRVKEQDDLREVFEETFTVGDKIKAILDAFQEVSELRFTELFRDMTTRPEVVVTFLAVLELIRLKKIIATQDESFGEVIVNKNFI